jgi:hypothetical protein
MVKEWMSDYVKPEHLKAVHKKLNVPQNFFKHANEDPDAVLDYDPSQVEVILLDACWAYRRRTGERLPLLRVFETWATLTFAREFVNYADADASH